VTAEEDGSVALERSQQRWQWRWGAEGGTSVATRRWNAVRDTDRTRWDAARRKSGVGSVSGAAVVSEERGFVRRRWWRWSARGFERRKAEEEERESASMAMAEASRA